MVICPASIRGFVEPAPVCLLSATVAEVIDLMGQYQADRLVLTDEQHFPIGLLSAHALLAPRSEMNLNRLMEALPTIEDTIEFEQIEFTHSIRYWAVIDRFRRFVGLVDSFYLRSWVEFVERSPKSTKLSSESLWHRAKTETATELERSRGVMQTSLIELSRLRQQVQITELGHPRTLEGERANSLSDPDSRTTLMQFLEHLPLPLMLQTQAGEVIAQNKVWTQQLSDLVDPSWVQRDAAELLEYATPLPEFVPLNRSHLFNPAVNAKLCQIGSAPNTCICVCSLKNGQERVLQFVKIPLGALLSPHDLAVTEFGTERSFRLAAFDSGSVDVDRSTEDIWLVLVQDITEQQQLSRELAAKNADLVQLNRLKDEFLACISHELRTPLTAVLGLSSLLKDQLSGTLSERQVRYAQLIHRSGRHLMAIVNDILDLTRIETGQIELTLYAVSIKSLCDRAIEQAKQLCLEEEKPETRTALNETAALAKIELEIEPGLETLVADELRLRQMLVHLLSNALKVTDPSGRIGVRVNRWEGWIVFSVWDTGVGIPADKQHLIFQKFQQLENPMTRRFEGAGLGLVLTQRLARLHGGDVSFVSKENEGSEFTLLLPPTHPEPTSSLAISRSVTPTAKNRLVLVVEAVVKSIELLSEQLTNLGYRVMIARSGTEAVEKARRLQPCTVFLNPLLPTLSGWDVLTLLKAEPETRDIPVIITGTRGDREQAQRHHADGFVALPIVQKSLQQVLNQLTPDEMVVSSIEEPSPHSLVILRLSPTRYGELQRSGATAETDLNALLHSQNYRVVEADDLEQAELLAQVWKPNIVLLDAAIPDPTGYLKLLRDCSFLASLPLVTLDPATTQAANQVQGLSVFPCLAPVAETSALLQVIQVAAGFAWRPLVLAISSAKLRSSEPQRSDWLQAAMQYLQTAGFRGMIAQSWQDVLQKLDTQSIDLLLLHALDLDVPAIQQLSALKRFREKIAIVVINHQPENTPLLETIATVVLPPMPMEELLDQVNQALAG